MFFSDCCDGGGVGEFCDVDWVLDEYVGLWVWWVLVYGFYVCGYFVEFVGWVFGECVYFVDVVVLRGFIFCRWGLFISGYFL